MLKKMILLAMALAVVAAVGPTAASANWTKNHVALSSGENPHVLFEGTAKFESEVGSVDCGPGSGNSLATATVQLTGGTTSAHVKSFTVDNPGECTVGGLLGSLCGLNSLTSAGLTHEASISVATGNLEITEVELVDDFGECLELTLRSEPTSTLTANPEPNRETIAGVNLAGALEEGLFEGTIAIGGTLSATPSGEYGF